MRCFVVVDDVTITDFFLIAIPHPKSAKNLVKSRVSGIFYLEPIGVDENEDRIILRID